MSRNYNNDGNRNRYLNVNNVENAQFLLKSDLSM